MNKIDAYQKRMQKKDRLFEVFKADHEAMVLALNRILAQAKNPKLRTFRKFATSVAYEALANCRG